MGRDALIERKIPATELQVVPTLMLITCCWHQEETHLGGGGGENDAAAEAQALQLFDLFALTHAPHLAAS